MQFFSLFKVNFFIIVSLFKTVRKPLVGAHTAAIEAQIKNIGSEYENTLRYFIVYLLKKGRNFGSEITDSN